KGSSLGIYCGFRRFPDAGWAAIGGLLKGEGRSGEGVGLLGVLSWAPRRRARRKRHASKVIA
ncbi:MAG: hypothetical protein QOI13_2353, partial [Paraburkholderia sp.]|nr:hypothetical protein [Paraburkholderia sp.]